MIEPIIQQIIASLPASCADGWLDDAEHFFCEHKAWTKARAFRREDQSCLLELKALVSEDIQSLGDLRNIQRAIWRELAWSHLEAISVIFYKQASVLRFITVSKSEASSLTGRMIVGGSHYFELTRRWTSKSDFRKELEEAPFAIDFSDMDETVLSLREANVSLKIADWNEDKILVAELVELLRRVQTYTSIEDEFLTANHFKDAVLFNLDALVRISGKLRHRDLDLLQWRQEITSKLLHPKNKAWMVDSTVVWEAAKLTTQKLAQIIDRYAAEFSS